jgi:hypothetical protein
MKELSIYIFIVFVIAASAIAFRFFFGELFEDGSASAPYAFLDWQMIEPVEALIAQKAELIRGALLEDEVLADEIRAANASNAELSMEEILSMDEQWISASVHDLPVKPYLENAVSAKLREFVIKNPIFKEIFITDAVGLNVGMSNKTSDLYQADEEWWKESYSNGKGNLFHGPIEFDESSESRSIALFIPFPAKDGRVIGIIKAIIDLESIKSEL